MTTVDKIEAEIRSRQEKFIETRTQIELELNRFLNSIARSPEEIQRRCNYRSGVTARVLLPALWSEPFDEEEYKRQRAAVNAYVASVIKIRDAINEEAERCLRS